MKIEIMIRTVQGLPQYLVYVNGVQLCMFYTRQAAEAKVLKLMKTYEQFEVVNCDEVI